MGARAHDNKRRAKQERLRSQEAEVMMGETNRGLVERVLREFFRARGMADTGVGKGRSGGPEEGGAGDSDDGDGGDVDTLVATLCSLGFAKQYVTSAVKAVGVHEERALDWLCRHVPEAELPPYVSSPPLPVESRLIWRWRLQFECVLSTRARTPPVESAGVIVPTSQWRYCGVVPAHCQCALGQLMSSVLLEFVIMLFWFPVSLLVLLAVLVVAFRSMFDPRGKQLDVVLPGMAFGTAQGPLQRLQNYGFSLADSQRALAGTFSHTASTPHHFSALSCPHALD